MKWGRCLFLLLTVSVATRAADELHLRDGTVIVGTYVGGTQKEIYFQHTPAGSDMYPLLMVESVKFNATPGLVPGASLQGSPASPPSHPAAAPSAAAPDNMAARIRWVFALLFPPSPAPKLASASH